MAKKTVPFTPEGISKLPNDKPVVYKILTAAGDNNYVGIAKRGRVRERLEEHLPGAKDQIPGTRVQIEQVPSIDDAKAKEARIIESTKPRHNERGT